MNNITGSPVQGADFHGRAHELEKLRRSIEIFKDVLLLSPRRVGKSSLSLEMARRLREEGWLIILCDAQDPASHHKRLLLVPLRIHWARFPGRVSEDPRGHFGLRTTFRGSNAPTGSIRTPVELVHDLRKAFADTLLLLNRDGYVIQQDGNIAFRSPVLRDYWHNRYFP